MNEESLAELLTKLRKLRVTKEGESCYSQIAGLFQQATNKEDPENSEVIARRILGLLQSGKPM